MELTINEALAQGVKAHQAGQIQEADRYYTAILQADPSHPDANHNMGILAVGIGKIQEALPFFKAALEANSKVDQFWFSYCDALIKLNRFDDARAVLASAVNAGLSESTLQTMEQNLVNSNEISANADQSGGNPNLSNNPPPDQLQRIFTLYSKWQLQQALAEAQALLQHYPNSTHLHNLCGASLSGLGQFDKALEHFERALSIDPNDASVHNNMGLALQNKGDNHSAIRSFKQVLTYQPGQAETHNNLANALQDVGEIDAAIYNYTQALTYKPQFSIAAANLRGLEVQLQRPQFKIDEMKTTEAAQTQSLLLKDLKYQTYEAIWSFITGDLDQTSRLVKLCEELSQAPEYAAVGEQDKHFCEAYSVFLSKLVRNNSNIENSNNSRIYHIGESHCLSYAHSSLEVENTAAKISPMITFGAKAHHFSTQEENAYKAITQQNLCAIPQNSTVFISFGEIDCRADEGIIPASRKSGKELSDIVDQTVTGYIAWFLELNKTNQHTCYFFNIPAPVFENKLSSEVNLKVAEVVALFNAKLETELLTSNANLIDVYQHTRAEDGFSNQKYHCDTRHLDTRILGLIQKQVIN